MKEIDVEEMIANSRELVVSLVQPDGSYETYRYLVDTPAFCTKIENNGDETHVDFDFIPEWVTNAVWPLIKTTE